MVGFPSNHSKILIDFQRLLWREIPQELVGKSVRSLDEIQGLFPSDKIYDDVIVQKPAPKSPVLSGFDLYVRPMKMGGEKPVAYACRACVQEGNPHITIGSPSLTPGPDKEDEDISFYCTGGHLMDHHFEKAHFH